MSIFKQFQVKYDNLVTVNGNFAVQWIGYQKVLARCPLEYIGHYCKSILKAKLYIHDEVMSLLNEFKVVNTASTNVEQIQLADMSVFLNKIKGLMNEKVGKIGRIMYARSSTPLKGGMGDIRYNKCEFNITTGQFIIVSSTGKLLLNLPADQSFNSTKSLQDMSVEINSLVIPIPPDAQEGYNHNSFLLSSSAEVMHPNLPTVVENITNDIDQFNKTNGLGSRQQSVRDRRKRTSFTKAESEGEEQDSSESFSSPVSGLFDCNSSAGNTTLESLSSSSSSSSTHDSGASLSFSSPVTNDDSTASKGGQQAPLSPDFDNLEPLVNHSCGTPQQFDAAAEFITKVPYNFSDESKNAPHTSLFLTVTKFDESSDDEINEEQRLVLCATKAKRYPPSSRWCKSQSLVRNNYTDDEEEDEESIIDEDAPDDAFFVPDGTYEGKHPASAFFANVNRAKAKPVLKQGGLADEEYTSSSDEEAKRYNVKRSETSCVRSKSTVTGTSSYQRKRWGAKASLASSVRHVLARVNHKPPVELAVEDASNFSKVLKSVVIKKRSREEYKANPIEDLTVHVTNELRTFVPPQEMVGMLGTDQEAVVEVIAEAELKTLNRNIDRKFVLFLVRNCTTRIGNDIGLERCILDYLCKKQTINNLSPNEQQRIENLEEIFLSIECLISDAIKSDRDCRYNVLERAHQRTKSSIVMKSSIRLSLIQQSEDLTIDQKLAEERLIRQEERALAEKLALVANQAKSFNEQTYRSSLRKIHTTLHNVCGKFCVIWLEANNCISELNPQMLRHFKSRALTDAASIRQLVSATKNGIFLLDSDLELADGVETRGTPEEQKLEEDELRRILDNDHVEQVTNTIKSIAEDADRIKSLIKIVWTKESRVKLSHTIAKAKKTAEKEASAAAVIAAASFSSPDQAQSLTPTARFVQNGIPVVATSVHVEQFGSKLPQTLEAAAVGSQKITSFYGHNPSTSSSILAKGGGNAADKFLADPNSSLSKIAQTFDKAFRLITARVQVVSDTQCLEVTVKSSTFDAMLSRLKLFQFMLANKNKLPSDVVAMLQRTDMYDLFDCYFLIKAPDLNGANTLGDGYCFNRCLHQLYYRSENDFKVTAGQMKAFDRSCNTSNPDNTNIAFRSFIAELPSLMKTETQENKTLVNIMGELVYFKRMKQLEVMPALLSVRPPGTALEGMFWGDLQTVPMMGFNVSAFATLTGNEFNTMVPKLRHNWIKYEKSSIPTPRSPQSLRRSKRPLSELDQVIAEDLNIMVYSSMHYFVCDSPDSIENVGKGYDQLKASVVKEIFKRIDLVEEMTVDAGVQLDCLISNAENKSQLADYDYFDFATFRQAFVKKFPDGVVDTDMVDLTYESEEEDVDKEVHKLKEALELSLGKMKIVEDYGKVLRDNCCALMISK